MFLREQSGEALLVGIVQMKVEMKVAEGLDHWSSPIIAQKHSYFPATPILAGDLRAPQSVSTLRTVKGGTLEMPLVLVRGRNTHCWLANLLLLSPRAGNRPTRLTLPNLGA